MSISLAGLIILIAWIAAIVDCLKSSKETNKKILWIIIIFVVPVLGTILWFVLGKNQA